MIDVRSQQIDLRITRKNVHLYSGLVGQPLVVAVEQRDPLTCRGSHARVSGRGYSSVGLANQPDIGRRVGFRIALDKFGAAVRRAVVHDDDLVMCRIGLSDYRIEGFLDGTSE